MINPRADRKRPSAVLEDRLEGHHNFAINSPCCSNSDASNIEKDNVYFIHSSLKSNDKRLSVVSSNEVKERENSSSEDIWRCHHMSSQKQLSVNYFETNNTMTSSPGKVKVDVGSISVPTNGGHDGEDTIHLKILVPSVAAGAIIGKGGETIADAQLKSGARVKMSKSNDFYPGTNERVCLITGNIESVSTLLDFIMDKIRHKPDPNAKPAIDFDNKVSAEREKQVKAIIPNSTAGMIIGKGGAFIKQLKDESGAFIQLSQKSKDTALQERVVTVIGEPENNRKAMAMIIEKIQEDPQSGSCLNISYSESQGLVANFNPTGSPYANSGDQNGEVRPGSSAANNGSKHGYQRGATSSGAMSPNTSNMSSSLPSTDSDNVPSPFVLPLQGGGSLQLRFNINTNRPPTDPALMSQYLDHIKGTLRSSGYYSDLVVDDIAQAINVLSSHGILVVNLISPTPAASISSPNHSQLSHQGQPTHIQQNMSSSTTPSSNGMIYRSGAAIPSNTLLASSDQQQLPIQNIASAATASINDAIMNNRQNPQQVHNSFQTRNIQQANQPGHHQPTLFTTSNNASLATGVGGQVDSHQINSFGLVHSNNHSSHLVTGGGGSVYAAAGSPRQATTYWTPASPNAIAGPGISQNGNGPSENGVPASDAHHTVAGRMIGGGITAAMTHQQPGGLLPLDSQNTSSVNLSSVAASAVSNNSSGSLHSTVPNLPEPFRGGPPASPFSQHHTLAATLPNQHQSKYSTSPTSQLSTTLAASSSVLATGNGIASSPQVVSVASVGSHQQGNKNSFGLGTVAACPPVQGLEEQVDQVELEINESIIGAVIGPSGKSIVDIQQFSCARIQISKKGTFSPGTRNRIVTIQGPPKAISTAKYLIEKKIAEEENKRERNSTY